MKNRNSFSNRIKTIIYIISLLIPLTIYSNTQQKILLEADSCLLVWNNVKAAELYSSVLVHSPENYEALLGFTTALNNQGEDNSCFVSDNGDLNHYREALEYCDKGIMLYPDSSGFYLLKSVITGNMIAHVGSREQVSLIKVIEGNARKATEIDSDNWQAYVVLGIFNFKLSGLNWALRTLAQAVIKDLPEVSPAHTDELYRHALSLEPDNLFANFEYGRYLMATGQEIKAGYYLDKVINTPPQDHLDPHRIQEASEMLTNLALR